MGVLHTTVIKLLGDTSAYVSSMTSAGGTGVAVAGNIDKATLATAKQQLAFQKTSTEIQLQTEKLARMNSAASANSTAVEKQRIRVEELKLSLQEMSTKQSEAANTSDKLTTAVTKSGDAAGASSGKFSAMSAVLAGVVAGATTAAIDLIINLGKQALNTMGAMGRWADQIDAIGDVLGTNANDSAALAVAIRRVGGDVGQLGAQLGYLGKNLKTADGKLGTSGEALKQLGVKATDAKGNLKDSAALMVEVANKVSKMPDGLKKSALMMQLFGKSGRDMSDVMNSLANGGFKNAGDMAKKLGLAIGDDGVDQALSFKRGIAEMQLALEGLAVSIGGEIVPLILPALQQIGGWIINNMPTIRATISNVISTVGGFVSGVVGKIQGVFSALQGGGGPNAIAQALGLDQNALGGAIAFISSTVVPAIQAAISTVQYGAGVIGQALGQAWAQMQPAVQAFAAWLQERLPQALQAASTFFQTTLLPALRSIYDFIAVNVIPIIGQIISWLLVNLPPAIDGAAVFIGKLVEAFKDVYNWLSTYLFPIFEQIGTIVGIVLTQAFADLSVFWTEKLLPAMQQLWNFISEKMTPVFEELGKAARSVLDWIQKTLADIQRVLGQVIGGFNGVRGQSVAGQKFTEGNNFTAGQNVRSITAPVYVTINANVSGEQDWDRVAREVGRRIQLALRF